MRRSLVALAVGLGAALAPPRPARSGDDVEPTLWDAVRAARSAADRGDANGLAAVIVAPSKPLVAAGLVALTPAALTTALRGVGCTKGRALADPLDAAGSVTQVVTGAERHFLFHGRIEGGAARLTAIEDLDPLLFVESSDAHRHEPPDPSVAFEGAAGALRAMAAALRARGGLTETAIRERFLASTFDLRAPETLSAFGDLLKDLTTLVPLRLTEVPAAAPSAADRTFVVSGTRVTLVREDGWRIRSIVAAPDDPSPEFEPPTRWMEATTAVVAAINADDAVAFARWALDRGRATPTPASLEASRAWLTSIRAGVSGKAVVDPLRLSHIPLEWRRLTFEVRHDGGIPLHLVFVRVAAGWRLLHDQLRGAETERVDPEDVVPRGR